MRVNRRSFLAAAAGAAALRGQPKAGGAKRTVYVVPNFHPASCGWLTTFSKERVFCANSYLDHLDRVRDDPNYAFVLSEVNNLIAIMNFRPERIAEIRQRIQEGRLELVNAFFLESTINLSGGEAQLTALVRALRETWIAGAGLDVYEHEPQISPELLPMPNTLLLPHLGSATVETRRRMSIMAV